MLPEWLDYASSEYAAAAMFRELRGLSGDWGELIATAQTVMSTYQDLTRESVDRWYSEEQVLPLIAASRILDLASQHSAELTPDERTNLGLTAAVAFAMYGNFPSANAVVRRTLDNVPTRLSSSAAALVATAAPMQLQSMLRLCEQGSPEKEYLEQLEYFLRSGDVDKVDTIRDAFIECLLAAPSSFESSLFRSARLSLEHVLTLSVARNLGQYRSVLPEGYIAALVDSGVRVLLPPQFRALAQGNLLIEQGNAIIALPTSTGKTLLGELCLLAALGRTPGIVCYLAPYIALGTQVAGFLRQHVPSSIRIHSMFGGYRETEQLDPANHQEIIVATPERLDSLLRLSPDLIPYLRCVVCDEAHTIENDSRGIRLEGLITRLRLLQSTNTQTRLILLSAVLSQYGALQQWIDAGDDSVITDTWKPTARRVAFWRQNGRLTYFVADSPIRRQGDTSGSVIGYTHLPWPEPNFYLPRNYGQVRSQEPLVHTNVAYLVSRFAADYSDPILCVCATKGTTRKVARAVAQRFPVRSPIPTRIATAINLIKTRHRFLLPMCELLERGIAFHNSTVPSDVRTLIEDAVRHREIQVVAATTTLAEGVDLPFRFTIVVDWLSWRDGEQRPMAPLLFKNVAGRCGRANVYTEGDTVVFDNPVGNLDFTHPYRRWDIQQQLFLDERPVELMSAMEVTPSTPDQRDAFEAVLASQFIAAIPENPDTEDLVEQFSKNTFAAHRLRSTAPVLRMLTLISDSLLDDTDAALARAASPLHLTPLGTAVNATGLSPRTCRDLIQALRDMPVPQNSWLGLVKLASDLLRALGRVPEQTYSEFRKVLSNPGRRAAVKPEDLESVISSWLSGEPLERIFFALPYVQRSTRRPTAWEWLDGTTRESTWDAEYDKFVEFSRSILEGFLPWTLRACEALSEFVDSSWTELNWRRWADMMELGVDSAWAVGVLEAGAPVERQAAVTFGREWSIAQELEEPDPIGLELLRRDRNSRLEVEGIFRRLLNARSNDLSPEESDLLRLRTWLWEQAGFYPAAPDEEG